MGVRTCGPEVARRAYTDTYLPASSHAWSNDDSHTRPHQAHTDTGQTIKGQVVSELLSKLIDGFGLEVRHILIAIVVAFGLLVFAPTYLAAVGVRLPTSDYDSLICFVFLISGSLVLTEFCCWLIGRIKYLWAHFRRCCYLVFVGRRCPQCGRRMWRVRDPMTPGFRYVECPHGCWRARI